jgi:hypothetical protein
MSSPDPYPHGIMPLRKLGSQTLCASTTQRFFYPRMTLWRRRNEFVQSARFRSLVLPKLRRCDLSRPVHLETWTPNVRPLTLEQVRLDPNFQNAQDRRSDPGRLIQILSRLPEEGRGVFSEQYPNYALLADDVWMAVSWIPRNKVWRLDAIDVAAEPLSALPRLTPFFL